MVDFVFSFGIFEVFIIDSDRELCGVFDETLQALMIAFCPLARGNHKLICAEKYHNF